MSHPTDWSVDSYRTSHESEEHWQLRQKFMERWKDTFPEDTLVCLARVFTNIEFLGCRYPSEVMRQVGELSKEVVHDYRESRKSKIKRTFVSASDAAGDKARGVRRPASEAATSEPQPKKKMFVSGQESKLESTMPKQEDNSRSKNNYNISESGNFSSFSSTGNQQRNNAPSFRAQESFRGSNFRNNDRSNRDKNNYSNRGPKNKEDFNHLISSEYGSLVLYDRGGTSLSNLQSSCQTCKVPFKNEYQKKVVGDDFEWICSLEINNIKVCSGSGPSQKEAREAACKEGWQQLKRKLYTVRVKQRHSSKEDSVISAQDSNANSNKKQNSLLDGLDTKVDSAVAMRMMKMMGWKGGALGSSGDGISEPIQPNLKQIKRAGLGSKGGDIEERVRQAMMEYAKDGGVDYDLVFASDFTKDERAVLHKLAQRLSLKSKSYGKDDERYMVISKHVSVGQLVKSLIDSGGSNQKYELIPPTRT